MTHHNEARTEKTDLWKKNKNILLVLFKRKKERKIWYCSKKVHSGKKNNVSVLAPIGGLHMPSVRLFESVFGRKCLLEKNQTELESYLGGPIQVRGSSSSGLAANTTKPRENLRVMVCHVLVFPEWPTGWKGLCHRKLTVAPSLWLYSNSNFMCFKLPFCFLPSKV